MTISLNEAVKKVREEFKCYVTISVSLSSPSNDKDEMRWRIYIGTRCHLYEAPTFQEAFEMVKKDFAKKAPKKQELPTIVVEQKL